MIDVDAVDIMDYPFDGTKGWIAITTFDLTLGKPGRYYTELGYQLIKEAVSRRGTIWVYLQKL